MAKLTKLCSYKLIHSINLGGFLLSPSYISSMRLSDPSLSASFIYPSLSIWTPSIFQSFSQTSTTLPVYNLFSSAAIKEASPKPRDDGADQSQRHLQFNATTTTAQGTLSVGRPPSFVDPQIFMALCLGLRRLAQWLMSSPSDLTSGEYRRSGSSSRLSLKYCLDSV